MRGLKWGGCYLLIVLIFSFFYYAFWLYRPDSFIINTELNVHPIYDMNKMLWDDIEYDYRLGDGVSLKELKKVNDEYVSRLSKDKDELTKIDAKIQEVEGELDALYEIQNGEIEKNTKKYKQEKLQPFIVREKELEKIVENLEKDLPLKIKTGKDVQKIQLVGDKRIELAKVRLEKAQQSYNNADFILSNLVSFISQETRDRYAILNKTKVDAGEERFHLEKSMADARSAAINNVGEYINRYTDRLNAIDFFYFSIGISTTTTFGDIVASDRIVRAVVSFQLILCIFIVGGFVSSVINRAEQK